MDNYEELSKKTGISVWEFEVATGRPLIKCAADTVEEAIEAYIGACSDSEAEAAALSKWDELTLKEVAAADTVEEAIEAYHGACSDSEAETAALIKIIKCHQRENIRWTYS